MAIAADTSKKTQNDALGEQLSDNAAARRAERGANRGFAQARAAAGKQQIGHVGASDDKHEGHASK